MDQLEGIITMLTSNCDDCDGWCEGSGCDSDQCDKEG